MKNIDFKKLFILIGIIAAIAVVIVLVVNSGNKNKLTEEETKDIENISINYFAKLTEGYTTVYGGIDVLYQRDEVTYKTLAPVEIINIATKYANDNEYDTSVSDDKLKALEASKKYGKMSDYTIYSGESIRKAIKELFGEVEYYDISAINNYNFIYDFIFDSINDVYLVKRNSIQDPKDKAQGIEHKIISTKAKDDQAIVTIAVAYTYKEDSNTKYAKDSAGENIISENASEFPEDKVDEFDKYEITLKKSSDNKYVFESIKKVK